VHQSVSTCHSAISFECRQCNAARGLRVWNGHAAVRSLLLSSTHQQPRHHHDPT
jgi:hypothetical protein